MGDVYLKKEENLVRSSRDSWGLGGHTSSGWSRVNFLHISWYGVVFWICGGNSMDNTGILWLSLSSACTVLVTGNSFVIAATESRPFLPLIPLQQRGNTGG